MCTPRFSYLAARWCWLAMIMCLSVAGVFYPASVAAQTTFVVTATADDANTDGCMTTGGSCSLRAAIGAANRKPGADTIQLPAGTYALALVGANEDGNATGDLDIVGALTLVGAGRSTTIIDAKGLDRVLDIRAAVSVTLDGVTLTGGHAPDGASAGQSGADGGGIVNRGKLTLNRSAVTRNRSGAGAASLPGEFGGSGGKAGGILNERQLTLVDTLVTGNRAGAGGTGIEFDSTGGGGGSGGAIFNGGQLSITTSTIRANAAGDGGDSEFVSSQGGPAGLGGAVFSDLGSAVEVRVSRSTISGNAAGTGGNGDTAFGGGSGGAFYVGGGVITIADSVFNGNRAGDAGGGGNSGSGGGSGGALFIAGGAVTIANTTFNGNSTGAGTLGFLAVGGGGNGGAIAASAIVPTPDNRPTILVSDSTVTANATGEGRNGSDRGAGGGIFVSGSLTVIRNSVISDNTAGNGSDTSGTLEPAGRGGNGGGIALTEPTPNMPTTAMTIIDSIISGNGAGRGGSEFGSGGAGGNGGGIYDGSFLLDIRSSTIISNTSGDVGPGDPPINGGPGQGGGIFTTGSARLTNVTLSGNQSFGGGGGLYAFGEPILANSTIANNSAAFGGGIAVEGFFGNPLLRNTIVANNRVPNGAVGPDCAGKLTSDGFNLVRTPRGCMIEGDTEGVITGKDPRLAPLADNGGTILTHALLTSSPAIDAANPAGCTDADGSPLRVDARGEARPGTGTERCDIGAYEYQRGRIFLPLILTVSSSSSAAPSGSQLDNQ